MLVFESLLETATGAVLIGLCLGLSIIVSVVSLGLFSLLRSRLLFYFGIATLALYVVMALAAADPRSIPYDRLQFFAVHFSALMFNVFWYLTAESVPGSGRAHERAIDFLRISFAICVLVRLVIFFVPTALMTRMVSLFSVTLLLSIVAVMVFSKPRTFGTGLFSVGCVMISVAQLPYLIMRAGFFTTVLAPIVPHLPSVIVASTALFSALCLLGLIIEAKEVRGEERLEEYEMRARGYLEMRDQMNTPLQTLECAVELLKEDGQPKVSGLIVPIKHSLESLRQLNETLMRYENRMVWDSTVTTHRPPMK